jgi:hypothetical protein
MAANAAAAVPPLPPGFTLDGAPAAPSASSSSGLPPLPPGFTLDSSSASAPTVNVPNTPGFDPTKTPTDAKGNPTGGRFNIGQAALGAAEDAATVGTGTLAAVPAAFQYVKTLGLTLDPQAAAAAADATQSKYTYQPRTAAGQAGIEGVGQVLGAAPQAVGHAVTAGLNKLDPTGNLATTASDVAGGVGHVLPLLPVAGEASALSRGGGVTRTAAEAAVNAGRRELATATAPAGVEYDANGAITPKPAATAPAAGTAAAGDNTIGASASAPPRFNPASEVTRPTAPAETPEAAVPNAPSALPPEQQANRAATLKAVGLDDSALRDSAVSGDAKAAATDYQQSKLDNEGGQKAAAQFSKERDALSNYTDQLVADSGGTTGLDETSLHNRGSAILQPLQDLSDHLDDKISTLYQRADAAAGGQPVELSNTAKALANKPEFIGTTEGQQLLRGASAYLRQTGIADDAGTVGNATVQQAERFKQYLNNQWSPRTARLIRTLKDSVDDDVTGSAGGDVYAEARAARAARANLLDNPQGVASLLDTSGPNGINRAVNVERVPDAVARMPVDQFGHIVDTLTRMPAEMQPQAQGALGEIRSQFMQRMQEQAQKYKGPWNNRGVTQYLNNNSAKLAKVFSPAELQRMRTLNDAGHILEVDRSYPGAAAQGHNLATRLAVGAVKHGAGAIAAHVGGPLAVPVVEHLSGRVIGAIEGAAARKGPKIWKGS